MDASLNDLGSKLETQARLCGVTAHRVHAISSQQDAIMANLDAMKALLSELSEFQRRSFMVRLRQGISKKHPPGV